jgi:hypothetical protein
MGEVLSKAGRAALRAVVPALFVLALGLANAHDLNGVKAQATVFIVAAGTAVAAALQSFVPGLSWRSYVAEAYAKYLDAFTQAFAGSFLVLVGGWFSAPNWTFSTSAVTAILVGALTAGVRALQALLTPGEPVLDPSKEPKTQPAPVAVHP